MLNFGFVLIKRAFKVVYICSLEKDIDADTSVSSIFEIEWPPKSGTLKNFPEIDKVVSFTVEET